MREEAIGTPARRKDGQDQQISRSEFLQTVHKWRL
jgi:hypothetical protein